MVQVCTANEATVFANAALATAMGGTAAYATDADSFSATLRCHDPNGEVCAVTVGREARRTRPTRSWSRSGPGPMPCRRAADRGGESNRAGRAAGVNG